MPEAMFKNVLLRSLNVDILQRLRLKPISFEVNYEMEYPGKPINQIYFIEVGMASMTAAFSDGSEVDVGMFGFDSVIGISALMGTRRSLNRIYTQIAGYGFTSPIEAARKEFEARGAFHTLALRYVQSQLLHAVQTSACNAKHNAEQRLARSLLLCAERANSTTYALSQDVLASNLGSTRPTVSLAAGLLKEEGLIDYSRGVIRILDMVGLERRACECYRFIKNHLENLSEFESGIAERE